MVHLSLFSVDSPASPFPLLAPLLCPPAHLNASLPPQPLPHLLLYCLSRVQPSRTEGAGAPTFGLRPPHQHQRLDAQAHCRVGSEPNQARPAWWGEADWSWRGAWQVIHWNGERVWRRVITTDGFTSSNLPIWTLLGHRTAVSYANIVIFKMDHDMHIFSSQKCW